MSNSNSIFSTVHLTINEIEQCRDLMNELRSLEQKNGTPGPKCSWFCFAEACDTLTESANLHMSRVLVHATQTKRALTLAVECAKARE